jgi:sec-independent protein translocase protein TatA
MGGLGFQELLIIAVVILVLFGARKIPEFMKGLGRGVREFTDATKDKDKDKDEQKREKE